MRALTLRADLLLLLTALIWGLAFVAQRVGMEYVGPFTFNAFRFALGGLSLLIVSGIFRKRVQDKDQKRHLINGGIWAGLFLFAGASLQQIGLVYTSAGNAGFITGLYVVIVPIIGAFFRQKPGIGVWIGALVSATGLYLLSVNEDMSFSQGDLLVLAGAFFWAAHVHIIGKYSPLVSSIKLAIIQFLACSLLSFVVALLIEKIEMQGLINAAIPILYGGLMSVGIAYTLQIIAQKKAHPAHAAIILSLESVFAAAGGMLILGEVISIKAAIGCLLMLIGMLLAQAQVYLIRRKNNSL